ncbi:hypothetical protein BS47DRAFT_1357002 [Hydnum rufescens UP504]|uniref:Uncharacterized protein n=1 Tax=Hydnum rufescens UP504 TaxID=1448309 RepID=A0A9P6E2D8_9AGAM|nr:hypothetical protein BS47DRAFT_1357002 [Hydnum rufescens UP504]
MQHDATNAQLALSGMVVTHSRNQLAAKETKKTKEKSYHINNMFGQLVTHSKFQAIMADIHKHHTNQEQAMSTRQKLTDAWKSFKMTQDAEIASWKAKQDQCKAAGLKAPPKPHTLLKKAWMAQNDSGGITQTSGNGSEGEGSEDGGARSDETNLAEWSHSVTSVQSLGICQFWYPLQDSHTLFHRGSSRISNFYPR